MLRRWASKVQSNVNDWHISYWTAQSIDGRLVLLFLILREQMPNPMCAKKLFCFEKRPILKGFVSSLDDGHRTVSGRIKGRAQASEWLVISLSARCCGPADSMGVAILFYTFVPFKWLFFLLQKSSAVSKKWKSLLENYIFCPFSFHLIVVIKPWETTVKHLVSAFSVSLPLFYRIPHFLAFNFKPSNCFAINTKPLCFTLLLILSGHLQNCLFILPSRCSLPF